MHEQVIFENPTFCVSKLSPNFIFRFGVRKTHVYRHCSRYPLAMRRAPRRGTVQQTDCNIYSAHAAQRTPDKGQVHSTQCTEDRSQEASPQPMRRKIGQTKPINTRQSAQYTSLGIDVDSVSVSPFGSKKNLSW